MNTHKTITSLTNPSVKRVVQLRDRPKRAKQCLTVVEGQREIGQAITAGFEFEEIFFVPSVLKDKRFISQVDRINGQVYEVTKSVMEKMAYGQRNESVLGVCVPKQQTFEHISLSTPPLVVIVEQVEKPGNLGAILRTCDGAGVDGVVICDGKTDLYNPNVIRSSLGAVFTLPVIQAGNDDTLEFIRKHKLRVCAAVPDAKEDYAKSNLTGALALVVGSEDKGLTPFWQKNADVTARIPMRGAVDSLNVSAAAAIMLYEILRQR